MNDVDGSLSEDLVEAICHRMCFRDFVARSPSFKRGGGEAKEAADVLVLFRETLVAFQVKARLLAVESDPTSATVLGRLQKRVHRMVDQLKTIKRAIDSGFLTKVTTGRGIDVPLDPSSITKLVGVAVLDIVDEEELPEEERPDLLGGFTDVHGVPTHVFLRSTFEAMAAELDTLPDFLAYLEVRQELLQTGKLPPLTRELDLLATFQTDYPTIEKVREGEVNLLVLEDGIWEAYLERAAEARARRAWKNQPSYLIDEIIESFHTSVGFKLPDAERGPLEGTVEGYLRAIAELAVLDRLRRRALGELLLKKMKKADERKTGFGIMMDGEVGTGYLVLSTERSRSERRDALGKMVHAMTARFSLGKAVGIATEPMSSSDRSFDLAVVSEASYTPEELSELTALADQLFGPPREFTMQDWD